MHDVTIWLWLGFSLFVLALLSLDLGVFHRRAHAVSVKEAAVWVLIWVSLAFLFDVGLYLFWDRIAPGSVYNNGEAALAFLAGYLIEEALSVDNIFVFVLIFDYFSVPAAFQHRVLFWGILGALVMRGAMILLGSALLAKFHWVTYLFGGFLIFTGIKMALPRPGRLDPEKNPVIRVFRRWIPVTEQYEGERFFLRRDGKVFATPLFLVLLMVESTDLVFAVDSIPAIFAVTNDPFIVYTSNVFAILGLRSIYFLLAGIVHRLRFIKLGLSVVLAFVGVKMVLAHVFKIPIGVSLGIIAGILAVAAAASLLPVLRPQRGEKESSGPAADKPSSFHLRRRQYDCRTPKVSDCRFSRRAPSTRTDPRSDHPA